MEKLTWKIAAIVFFILFIGASIFSYGAIKSYSLYREEVGEDICIDICRDGGYQGYEFKYEVGCECSKPLNDSLPYWVRFTPEGEFEVLLETYP